MTPKPPSSDPALTAPLATRFRARLVLALLLLASLALIACSSGKSTASSPALTPAPTVAPAPPPTAIPTATAEPTPTPTLIPTATATPTATPTPAPTLDDITTRLRTEHNLADLAPLGDCTANEQDPVEVVLTCPAGTALTPPLAGRVVFVSALPGSESRSSAPEYDPSVSWEQPSAGAPIVVVDHGAVGGHRSVMSVLSHVDAVDPEIALGRTVGIDSPIAQAGPDTTWTLLINDRAFGVEGPATPLYPVEEDLADAAALADRIQQPVDPICGFNPGALSGIPNANRGYRNGTHRGIDFGCGTRGQNAYAAMDGTVIVAVTGYADASPEDRNALLASTGLAGFTPRWTLNMLYGNFVIIEHAPVNGKETITLSAHLETVDPAIVPGATVTRGQRIGEIGNRGTNASAVNAAAQLPGNLHLHWEIYVGGNYLGAGKNQIRTQQIYMTLFG